MLPTSYPTWSESLFGAGAVNFGPRETFKKKKKVFGDDLSIGHSDFHVKYKK